MVQANLFDVGVFPGTLYLLHSMENEANQGLLPLFCHESAKSENLNSQQPTSISVFRFSMNLRYHLGSPNFQIFTRLVSCAFHSARHAYHGVNTTNGYFALSLEIRLFRQYAMLLNFPAFPVPPSSHPNQNPDAYPCKTKMVLKDLHSTVCDKCIFLVWAKGTAPIKGFLQHI